MRKLIYSKLEQCPYIQRKDLEEWPPDDMFFSLYNSFDNPLALLLTLLPNLQSIFFVFVDDYASRYYTHRTTCMLAWISKANETDQQRPHALSRLVSLDQTWDSHRLEYVKPLIFYLPFTGLPSVRSLSGDRVDGQFSKNFYVPSMLDGCGDAEDISKTLKSGITTIEFINSDIPSSSFEQLLCRIGALQDFTYESDEIYGFEPCKILNSLLSNAGHSLVRLHLTCSGRLNQDGLDPDDLDPSDYIFIGSLRGFQVLKTITVNNAMFIEMCLDTEAGGKILFKVHSLVDQLPTSIEKLSLYSHEDFCIPGNIFDGLLESKARRFPKLKKIKLNPGVCDLKQAYHDIRVEVVFPGSL